MAHARSHSPPKQHPFIRQPIRPMDSPSNRLGAIKSDSGNSGTPRRSANTTTATVAPISDPYTTSPPCVTFRIALAVPGQVSCWNSRQYCRT